jgi:hypothetical protein
MKESCEGWPPCTEASVGTHRKPENQRWESGSNLNFKEALFLSV